MGTYGGFPQHASARWLVGQNQGCSGHWVPPVTLWCPVQRLPRIPCILLPRLLPADPRAPLQHGEPLKKPILELLLSRRRHIIPLFGRDNSPNFTANDLALATYRPTITCCWSACFVQQKPVLFNKNQFCSTKYVFVKQKPWTNKKVEQLTKSVQQNLLNRSVICFCYLRFCWTNLFLFNKCWTNKINVEQNCYLFNKICWTKHRFCWFVKQKSRLLNKKSFCSTNFVEQILCRGGTNR